MKKLLIYIAAFAMILAMNTSCEDMGSLEEHPKKVDATTFMANAKEVESVINSIYFQLRRDPGFSRYLIVLEEGLADYCIGRGNYATAYDTGLTSGGVGFSKDSPAVARVEIEGLATTASSAVDGFTLEGIYVNNFFEKFNLAGTVVGTKVQYGATPAAYAQGQGLYTPANAGKLFDQSAVAATGIPKEVIPPTAGQRWAYQVVPNGNSTDANEQLQLVFKLSNLAAKAGSSVNFGTGDQFITVRGFKDGSGNIVELEKGKIYTISKADFTFDESNLSTIPNTSAVSVWLKVTVKAWTVVPVKPNL